jgi:type 1 glutamine amidotransferase
VQNAKCKTQKVKRHLSFYILHLAFCIVLLLVAAPSTQVPRPKILYLTHSAGFVHDVLPYSEQVMKTLGERSGAFEVVASKDCALVNAKSLADFAAVVFYTTGELPMSDAQKQDFLAFVRGGGGFAGFHSATDTFYKWPEYGELIGGYFDEHPWHAKVRIKVEDRAFPGLGALGPAFEITDEIYQFKNWSRANTHVLLSLDTSSVDLKKKGVKRTDGDFGIAWTRTYGKGRVYYNALGHRQEVWDDPRFQTMVVEGLKWVMARR